MWVVSHNVVKMKSIVDVEFQAVRSRQDNFYRMLGAKHEAKNYIDFERSYKVYEHDLIETIEF